MPERVYSTHRPTHLLPRRDVSLGVFGIGILLGFFAGAVVTMALLTGTVFP